MLSWCVFTKFGVWPNKAKTPHTLESQNIWTNFGFENLESNSQKPLICLSTHGHKTHALSLSSFLSSHLSPSVYFVHILLVYLLLPPFPYLWALGHVFLCGLLVAIVIAWVYFTKVTIPFFSTIFMCLFVLFLLSSFTPHDPSVLHHHYGIFVRINTCIQSII